MYFEARVNGKVIDIYQQPSDNIDTRHRKFLKSITVDIPLPEMNYGFDTKGGKDDNLNMVCLDGVGINVFGAVVTDTNECMKKAKYIIHCDQIASEDLAEPTYLMVISGLSFRRNCFTVHPIMEFLFTVDSESDSIEVYADRCMTNDLCEKSFVFYTTTKISDTLKQRKQTEMQATLIGTLEMRLKFPRPADYSAATLYARMKLEPVHIDYMSMDPDFKMLAMLKNVCSPYPIKIG